MGAGTAEGPPEDSGAPPPSPMRKGYSGNTEKKPPGDGHPSGAYFVLTWKYLLSWLSLVYARAFFLSS